MPNKKVRFLKEYNLINEKIVYVKDKDFLGYDSSNFNAFLFRYWKMKKFGISDNFIIMDDDCFIGKKLEKSDFFYVENGKVVPAIISPHFLKIEKESVFKNCQLHAKKLKNNKEEQGDVEWNYSVSLTFSFILNLSNISFEQNIFIPKFTHNAIPVNIREIKEVYDLVYLSKYRYNTLDCLYRISGYLQFQILFMSYIFINYGRKVSNISNVFIQLNDSISANYNYHLFCINTGAGYYNFLNYYKAKIVMEYLFPIPTNYEIIDYSFVNLSFNTVYSLDNNIKIYELKNRYLFKKKEFYLLQLLIILLFVLIFIKKYYKIIYIIINNDYFI